MKESARAALTYAKAHAAALRIPEDMFEREVHIHVPAGAVPKEGPSAGITMATALISALSGRPVRHDIAMTGEITLRGRVLPIGGLKEKILGAVRAGITRIVIPKDNEPDLEDLPRRCGRRIDVFPVQELGEALALTLRGASYREGRLLFGNEEPRDVVPLTRDVSALGGSLRSLRVAAFRKARPISVDGAFDRAAASSVRSGIRAAATAHGPADGADVPEAIGTGRAGQTVKEHGEGRPVGRATSAKPADHARTASRPAGRGSRPGIPPGAGHQCSSGLGRHGVAADRPEP